MRKEISSFYCCFFFHCCCIKEDREDHSNLIWMKFLLWRNSSAVSMIFFFTCPEVELISHVSSSSSRTAESLAYPSCLILPLCKLLSSPITRFPVSCRQSFPGFLSSLLAASFNCCCLNHDNLNEKSGTR